MKLILFIVLLCFLKTFCISSPVENPTRNQVFVFLPNVSFTSNFYPILPQSFFTPLPASTSVFLRTSSQVYQGQLSIPHSVPFAVAIFVLQPNGRLSFLCGGSILSNLHILTAGHCVAALNPINQYYVFLGAHDFHSREEHSRQVVPFQPANAVAHPEYLGSSLLINDVGIIRLDRSMIFSPYVTSVCLDSPLPWGTVVGWGIVGCGGESAHVLLQATGIVLANVECEKRWMELGRHHWFHPTQLCVQMINQAPNSGDSGGPLFVTVNGRHKQVAVVSAGLINPQTNCPMPEVPSIYTRIDQFRSFIEKVVGENVFC